MSTTLSRTWLLAMASLLIACAGGERSGPPGETAAERCTAFMARALTLDASSRASLQGALGAPDTVEAMTEPNRHIPDGIDSLFFVHYAGASATLRKPPAGGELLEKVVVTDARHLRWSEPGIGTAEARVLELLGEPLERDADVLVYQCGEGPVDEPVTFLLANGVVREVVFTYYVD